MPTLVVPFREAEGKSRLAPLSPSDRVLVAQAMLADVLAACAVVGRTFVVGAGDLDVGQAELVADPGGGQGRAVSAALDAVVVAGVPGPYLVVNADLPCATPRDLLALAGVVPEGGLAYAPASDGTTNAVAFESVGLFAPVYGPGSAERFAKLAPSRALEIPNLADDVDTLADLERLEERLGERTLAALRRVRIGAPA